MVVAAVSFIGLTSCNDFLTITPTDKIIGEEFWKTKDDVDRMVTGAYSNMLSSGVQRRAIIWGAFRSDELVKNTNFTSTDLDNISAVNLLPTNGYNSWGDFYSVINRCNIVLNHAKDVLAEDPEFSEGDYNTVCGQMLALRSLCYFYLVRSFRDVPYTTKSYESDDDLEVLPQLCPDSVLQYCINDLEIAEQYVLKTGAYGKGNWRNVGYFTRDAVDALLADIYLWRASMTKNAADYQKCVEYCDKIIQAKDAYYKQYNNTSVSGDKSDIYHLYSWPFANQAIFGHNDGNSRESILEWQYDGISNWNWGIENLYYMTGDKDKHKSYGEVQASSIFNVVDANANNDNGQKVYHSKNDYRFWNVCYEVNSEEAKALYIKKMLDEYNIVSTTSTVGMPRLPYRGFNDFRQNWIVYRLTDVMLMKAEALVQLSTSDDDENLKKAFNLVQAVNKRSMTITASDTLKINDFKTIGEMETLVLAERERELCFEGKRWFDLVRYSYRHMDGVDIKTKLADTDSWPALYKPMVKLITRKFDGGGDAVSYKMKSEPYLYFPIQRSEINVNPLLKQNPVWFDEETINKN